MNNTNEDVQIYGKLVNVSTEGIVTDATSVWSEKYKKTVEDVIKDVNDKVDDFRANPEFDKATFHGDVLFEGNTTVEGNTTTKGDSTVNGNQTINGMLDVYNKITAHGNPVGLEVDHRIVCNDLDVNGVFKALQLDCNTITVHNLIKSEGELRVDGDTILNNVVINGEARIPHATTKAYGSVKLAESANDADVQDVVTVGILEDYASSVLPQAAEGQILVYKGGKWQAGNIDTLVNNDTNIANYINSIVQQKINQTVDLSGYYTKSEVDGLLNDLKNNIGGDIASSCLWETSGSTLRPKNNKTVSASHFYKES